MTNPAEKNYIDTQENPAQDSKIIYGVFDITKDYRPSKIAYSSKKASNLRAAAIEGFLFGWKLFFCAVLGFASTTFFFQHICLPTGTIPLFFHGLFLLSTSCAWYCLITLPKTLFHFVVRKLISYPPNRL